MIHTGDCVEVMAGMEPASVDAIVTDPPYGLEFRGKEWDRLDGAGFHAPKEEGRTFTNASGHMFDNLKALPRFGSAQKAEAFHHRWATEAFRVAKPGAYLLAFGGTRTYHRMTCAIEDAGWIIRDCLVWAYASGFPKSRALLKPAWEPIVMARKPGPLRELAIDACRIGYQSASDQASAIPQGRATGKSGALAGGTQNDAARSEFVADNSKGRWPANLILTDPIFDGDTPGVVGGGEDYSRFFALPKADRAEREPVLGGLPTSIVRTQGRIEGRTVNDDGTITTHGDARKPRANVHPTVKPLELMRHLVRLVTPAGGVVLDPFLGSGTTALAAEMEGFRWVGIEKEPEYVAIAEARLNGTQRGLGLEVS